MGFEIRACFGTQQVKEMPSDQYGMLNLLLLLSKLPKGLTESDFLQFSEMDSAQRDSYGFGKNFTARIERFFKSFKKEGSAFYNMINIKSFSVNSENYYKIQKDRLELVFDMIARSQFANMISERRLFQDLVEIMLCQCRAILSLVTQHKRQGANEIEPELVTAHLNQGMWQSTCSKTWTIDHHLDRFNHYILTNVQFLFHNERFEEIVQDIFTANENQVSQEK